MKGLFLKFEKIATILLVDKILHPKDYDSIIHSKHKFWKVRRKRILQARPCSTPADESDVESEDELIGPEKRPEGTISALEEGIERMDIIEVEREDMELAMDNAEDDLLQLLVERISEREKDEQDKDGSDVETSTDTEQNEDEESMELVTSRSKHRRIIHSISPEPNEPAVTSSTSVMAQNPIIEIESSPEPSITAR